MYEFRLYLYISGKTANSVAVACNLKLLLDKKLKNQYSLEVVNLLDNPQRAQEDNILATPTLVKASPPPKRKIIGDFSNEEKVLSGLGLTEEERTEK